MFVVKFLTLLILSISFCFAEVITVVETSDENFYKNRAISTSFFGDVDSGDMYVETKVGRYEESCSSMGYDNSDVCSNTWSSDFRAYTKIEKMKLSSDLRVEYQSENGVIDCGYMKKKGFLFKYYNLYISTNCSLKSYWVKKDGRRNVKVVLSVE